MCTSRRVIMLLVALGGLTLLNSSLVWGRKLGGNAAYTMIPFRPPDYPSTWSRVGDLNDTGCAVGAAERPDGSLQAVHLHIATQVYTSLKSGSAESGAFGVNNLNQIVGDIYSGGLSLGAFWSSPSADPVLLPPLLGDVESAAAKTNDAGIVVGWSIDENGQRVGAVWRVTVDSEGANVDGPLQLTPLSGDSGSWAVDVNEVVDGVAQIAGNSDDFGSYEAVVWSVTLNSDGTLATPGTPRSVGTLGLDDPSESSAGAINNLGITCGNSDWWPVIALSGQSVQPLELPRKAIGGNADDINDHGNVVGVVEIWSSSLNLGVPHASLWTNGKVMDLEKQIPANAGWGGLWWADCINNAGVISGQGHYDVSTRGFLMIPN